VPWAFHRGGAVEAKGLWTDTWRIVSDGVEVTLTLTHQAVRDKFVVKLVSDCGSCRHDCASVAR
jgi:hypothetical protein